MAAKKTGHYCETCGDIINPLTVVTFPTLCHLYTDHDGVEHMHSVVPA